MRSIQTKGIIIIIMTRLKLRDKNKRHFSPVLKRVNLGPRLLIINMEKQPNKRLCTSYREAPILSST